MGQPYGTIVIAEIRRDPRGFGVKNKIIRLVTDSTLNNLNAFQGIVIPDVEQDFINGDDENSDDGVDSGALSDDYDYSCSTDQSSAIQE